MAKITDAKELDRIYEELEKLQDAIRDVIKIDDNEMHTDADIYDQLRNVLDAIDDLKGQEVA